jgi:hypothetical protein
VIDPSRTFEKAATIEPRRRYFLEALEGPLRSSDRQR